MITENQKQQIADRLQAYVERYGSAKAASKSLKGVSDGTISQMLNNNWELISEKMWRNVASQVNYQEHGWVAVETRDYKLLTKLLGDAQKYSNVFAVVGNAGSGKSFSLRDYAERNKRVYLLQCNEFWNRKMFMQELLSAMGRDYSGYTVGEMMQEVVKGLKTQSTPLIIMDEADKLSDQVMYFFITLYNMLEGHCGIVMCATDHLSKRIHRGLKLNKKGYKEIFSRIGRRFIELHGVGSADITSICFANGITGKKQVQEVVEDSEYDLRRVKRKIHALRMINNREEDAA